MKNSMKILLVAVIALLGMASCQKEAVKPVEPVAQSENVRIEITSPDAMATKAIGDGSKVKEVYYTAFVDGKPVASLQSKATMVDGKAALNLKLIKNMRYQFVFWAQAVPQDGEVSPYDLSEFYSKALVKADYQGKANDDSRDAFCAMHEILVQGLVDETVYLRRPFAQINFGAADYDMLKYLELHTGLESETWVNSIPDVLNVLDGSVSSSGQALNDVHFSLSAIPSGEDEYITVAGKQYGYVNMNYVFASEIGETISAKARMVNGQCKWETELLPNVPVRRNYRTNIIGDLFAEHASLQIIIEPAFNDPDFIVQ
jgi:hypothetical protein